MIVTDAIDTILADEEMASLLLDDEGRFIIELQGSPVVTLLELDDVLLFMLELPDLETDQPDILMGLLEAGFLGNGTGAGRMILGEDGETAALMDRVDPTHLDAAGLKERLSDFRMYAEYWASDGSDDLTSLSAEARAEKLAGLASDATTMIRV